jgi:hydroxylysine kinase
VNTSVRMLSYLDGVQVRDTECTPAQQRAMGTVLARLDLALRDFSHPAAAHEDLLWNVSAAHNLIDKLDAITDPSQRALAESFMNSFNQHVLPHLASMRAQVIHNDYHRYNVLVAPEDHERIVGIIDFGDMLHAPLVGEVATAAAFQMLDNDDPFARAAQFIGAYHQTLPLTDAELEIVTDLVATRHLITVLITEWRAARYPENRAYIMKHNPGAWKVLSQLAEISHDEARDRLLTEI